MNFIRDMNVIGQSYFAKEFYLNYRGPASLYKYDLMLGDTEESVRRSVAKAMELLQDAGYKVHYEVTTSSNRIIGREGTLRVVYTLS